MSRIIIEKDLAIPMRDGCVLKADLYRPEGSEKLPVLLNRTPGAYAVQGNLTIGDGTTGAPLSDVVRLAHARPRVRMPRRPSKKRPAAVRQHSRSVVVRPEPVRCFRIVLIHGFLDD